jgi:hypothetical protein
MFRMTVHGRPVYSYLRVELNLSCSKWREFKARELSVYVVLVVPVHK